MHSVRELFAKTVKDPLEMPTAAFKNFLSRSVTMRMGSVTLSAGAVTVVSSSSHFASSISTRSWITDWDSREPQSTDAESSKSHSNESVKSKASAAAKKMFLIRHGQYVANDPRLSKKTCSDEEDFILNDPLRPLTPLGREQAKLTGLRLAEILEHEGLLAKEAAAINLYSSDMSRAKETASIIKEQLESATTRVNKGSLVQIVHRVDSILREGPPIEPSPPHSTWLPSAASFASEGARIEAAFLKFFHRPDQKEVQQVDILVGHGNVWRYCFLRALQLPADAWLSLALYNASITRLTIRQNGHVSCSGLGEASHLPPSKITYS